MEMGHSEIGDTLARDLFHLAQHGLCILRPHACVNYQYSIATNDDPDVWNQIHPLVRYHIDVFSNLARFTRGDEWRLVLGADHSRESQNNRHRSAISKVLHSFCDCWWFLTKTVSVHRGKAANKQRATTARPGRSYVS